MNYNKKQKIKKILLIIGIVLSVLTTIAAVAMIANNFAKEEKKEIKLDWSIGALTDYGKYVKSDKSIYTEDSFKCNDLEVLLDFDSHVEYQVYFYDYQNKFISKSETLNESTKIATPEGAIYARIVITPLLDDLLDENDKEFSIKWYQVRKYSKQLKVLVAKNEFKSFEISNSVYKMETKLSDDGSYDWFALLPKASVSSGYDYYIYLKSLDDSHNFYEVVGDHTDEDAPDNYDYCLVMEKDKYEGKNNLEAIKFILSNNSSDFIFYIVNTTEIDHASTITYTYDLYFSNDVSKLEDFVDLYF